MNDRERHIERNFKIIGAGGSIFALEQYEDSLEMFYVKHGCADGDGGEDYITTKPDDPKDLEGQRLFCLDIDDMESIGQAMLSLVDQVRADKEFNKKLREEDAANRCAF